MLSKVINLILFIKLYLDFDLYFIFIVMVLIERIWYGFYFSFGVSLKIFMV